MYNILCTIVDDVYNKLVTLYTKSRKERVPGLFFATMKNVLVIENARIPTYSYYVLAENEVKVIADIEDYFKLQLGRPEILNRIGENIVVFDFIRPEVAASILQNQINKIADNMRSQKNIELVVSEKAFGILRDRALKNLDNGGRGIGNIVESLFVNPLSRYMFDHKLLSDCRIVVNDIHADAMPYTLECDA